MMVNPKFALALREALRYSRCGWLTLALIWSMPAAANFESGLSAYERGDYAAAMARWMPLAKSGFAAAQHNIAVMLDHGHGMPADDAAAISWYKRAANGGHAPSQHTLAMLYSRGQGVAKDMQQAVAWYRKAGQQGHSESQFILGVLYDFGKGVAKDERKAVTWYRKAAEQGDARAQYNLALMYDFGQGGLDNPQAAAEWYRHAAMQGNAKAQYMLGVAYLQGDGVELNNASSYAWMTLAAAAGHVRARQFRPHPWKKMDTAERKAGRALHLELRRRVRLRRSLSTETPGRLALPTIELILDTQRVLAQKGLLASKPDGVLGPQTRAAIQQLQKSLRLPQSGEPSTELLLLADRD